MHKGMKPMKTTKLISMVKPRGNAGARKVTLPKGGLVSTLNPNKGTKMRNTKMKVTRGH